MKRKAKRFKISKWICLSLAAIFNGFIIFYSFLDNDTTIRFNNFVTGIFVGGINDVTQKTVEQIKLDSISVGMSDDKYNNIPGYENCVIPLGSAKQIACSFSPDDATDKSITYTAYPEDSVQLSQTGSLVSVVGMKTGNCTITAISNDGGYKSSIDVEIVETVAPIVFDISLNKTEIKMGDYASLDFDIDGGVLTHNELITSRYYDIRKLNITSSNPSVAVADKYGNITPISTGTTQIIVSNGTITKTKDITVVSGTAPTSYSNLSISGELVCYENDMILDQNGGHHHYQLTPYDGENELNPEDFIWESSNELLVRMDQHGIMRGFRKLSREDETITVTAISKITKQEASIQVTLKNQIPNKMRILFSYDDKKYWDPPECTISIGEQITVNSYYDISVQNKNIRVTSSDEAILSATSEGTSAILHPLQKGTCTVRVVSILNPDLVFESKIKVVQAGAIDSGDIESFGKVIRKSVGHAAVFMVSQIFTFLTFYMFLSDKKWWFYSSISLGEGLLLAGLSEFIQFLVPSRNGTFLDILIDFAGVVVGAALTFLGIYIVKKIKEKKSQKETSKNN